MNLEPSFIALIAGGSVAALFMLVIVVALFFRRVVETNEVHIVQSAKKTTSYGKDTNNGNSYYEWPSHFPVIGVSRITLPMSVFDVDLQDYEAYDQDRLPFIVHVKAFFRIDDSNVAAQRVSSFEELQNQLRAIVQGAVRVILASHNIEEIMQGRSKFGEQFTVEVREQLKNWGVITVKNIELMDIRDSKESHVIKNIMEKKKSHIEMESRSEVAKNAKLAKTAEIEAQREVELQQQVAKQAVGLRTIEAERQVELQRQQKVQVVLEQEKNSKEKEMDVLKVNELRRAEIMREVQVVQAQQNKQTAVITAEADRDASLLHASAQKQTSVLVAEGQKETMVLEAEGKFESVKRDAEGIALQGTAKAAAEKAMQLAPVEAQIVLAKEIGGNMNYQNYLITIRQVEATQAVGMEQARALEKAEIKIISTAGTPSSGIDSVGKLFSPQGGVELGAMLEGFVQSDAGKKLVSSLTAKADKN